MRCSEARKRLIKSRGIVSEIDRDDNLRKHLLLCTECAAFAQAEQALHRDFAKVAIDDNAEDISLSALKSCVESRVRLVDQTNSKENSIMAAITRQMKKRPRLGLSLGIAAVILAFVTLVPFSFEHIAGYEVAIAGVNKDLAMDSEKISELLIALGMDNAQVDVGDCEATCKLKITELKTEYDVQVVVAAFNELGNCVLEEVKPIHIDERSPLISQATKNIFILKNKFEYQFEYKYEDKIHDIVVARLDELRHDSGSAFCIWVNGETGDTAVIDIIAGTDSCLFIGEGEGNYLVHEIDPDSHVSLDMWVNDDSCHGNMGKFIVVGDPVDAKDNLIDIDVYYPHSKHATIKVEESPDGSTEFVLVTVDGEVHRINLDDDDAIERLNSMGVDVQYVSNEDGTIHQMFFCSQNKSEDSDGQEPDESMAERHKNHTAALPTGYSLAQNFPNPFNPTTRIDFAVPETQHIRLEVFNVNGQTVRTLVDEVVSTGVHTVEWDSKDDSGEQVASGVYVYRLTAGDVSTSRKMTLLK